MIQEQLKNALREYRLEFIQQILLQFMECIYQGYFLVKVINYPQFLVEI